MDSSTKASTDRTRVRRLPERARYESETIMGILDAALVGHVGFADGMQPFVIPVTFVRVGDKLYFHGSSASRLLRTAGGEVPLCFTATLVDGLVFARSAFHHSMNYRSVVVLGRGRLLDDEAQKRLVLERLVDRFSAARSQQVRAPTELELRATTVIELSLDEASAKVRSGGPRDDAEDLELDCWAGVLPLEVVAGKPLAAAGVPTSATPPKPETRLELRER